MSLKRTVEALKPYQDLLKHPLEEISLYGLNELGYLHHVKNTKADYMKAPNGKAMLEYEPWPEGVVGPEIFQAYLQDITPPSPAVDMQAMVREFHEVFGAVTANAPRALPEDRIKLRLGLIGEELQELGEALADSDMVETYDAAIDILYVTFGLLVETGMDATPGFVEVHRSNMSKLGEDGKPIHSRGIEEDGYPEGKVLKGPNYFKPNLASVLDAQGF